MCRYFDGDCLDCILEHCYLDEKPKITKSYKQVNKPPKQSEQPVKPVTVPPLSELMYKAQDWKMFRRN